MAEHNRKYTTEQVAAEFTKQGGNVSATARALGLARSTVQEALRKTPLNKKPIAGGDLIGFSTTTKAKLPPKGIVKRYICTSAQNNTFVHKEFWSALQTLAEYYNAEILVGTYSYNMNAYGPLAVKQGTHLTRGNKSYVKEPWFDPLIKDYINDESLELGPGLVWCGEMNIMPTAVNPLAGLETYSHRKSAIFPHAKVAMRSIATLPSEGTKLNYTTGTVTLMNYIQKKEGIKAEQHHKFGALIVEVDNTGYWAVRQLGWSEKFKNIQDLDVVVHNGKVTTGNRVEAITWGDLHGTAAEQWVVDLSQEVLDTLKPKYQFLHDVMEGASVNPHVIKHAPDGHYAYNRWLRGLHRVDEELKRTTEGIKRYLRPWCETIVPDSNHDHMWLRRWLLRYDYRYDPANAELFLDLQKWFYEQIRENTAKGLTHKEINLSAYAFAKYGLTEKDIKFLLPDESFTILDKRIECGVHGHLGINGGFGTPEKLAKVGRRMNTAHTHSCGIWDGLYVAGTSSKLIWSYNWGFSSWSHSHILTYPSGQRSIITMYSGKWRAVEGVSK
jgi:hypothetical protein